MMGIEVIADIGIGRVKTQVLDNSSRIVKLYLE